ncbi:MAG: hypothetical protein RLN74_06080 [Ilumatobacter fluminis]
MPHTLPDTTDRHTRPRPPNAARPGMPASTLLLPLQLFLAAGWMRAGIEKVIEPDWWSGTALEAFLSAQDGQMLPLFVPFVDYVVAPWTVGVAWFVMIAQLAVAVCLGLGRFLRPALWTGVLLNVTFVMSGRVDPSAFYLVMEMALLFALARPTSRRFAMRRATLWSLAAAPFVPFVTTLHPAEVIHDPAMMMITLCWIAAITTIVRSIDRERLGPLAVPLWQAPTDAAEPPPVPHGRGQTFDRGAQRY